MQNINEKYKDIIELPHPTSKHHTQMALVDRAAQFSPFAALTGHSDVIDETAETLPEILAGADIVIFAMPVPAIIRTIEEFAADFRPGSIVTDLGSVKSGVMAAGRTHLLPRGVHFIGGHPMAGTEKSGPESAFPTLYDNADVFLCPFPETPPEKLDALKSLWESLNTHVVTIACGEHDDLVAHTSHVLHILASAAFSIAIYLSYWFTHLGTSYSKKSTGGKARISRIPTENSLPGR